MIYIDQKRVKDFSKERKILADAFPFTFSKDGVVKNPIPIAIELNKNASKVAIYVNGNTEMVKGYRRPSSAYHRISANGTFLTNGISTPWNYATVAPQMVSGELKFKREYVMITDGKTFDPVKDFELIVALYFYAPSFANNQLAIESGKEGEGMFKFKKQGEKAAGRIEAEKFKMKYYGILLDEENRISDESFEELCSLLNYAKTGVTIDDRVAMYDSCMGSETFRVRFDKIAKMIIDNSKSVKVSLGINDLVKSAKKAKVIMVEDSKWVMKNANGVLVGEVADAIGANQGEKDSNLVEYLKSSSVDVERIEELMSLVN